jgi:Fe2+ or Zn2+ uptake regulation protein
MDQLTHTLRRRGHRLTQPLKQILSILTPYPQSASQIFLQLEKQGIAINKSTLYRTLTRLHNLQLIQITHLQSQASYYELTPKHHHHHIYCTDCGVIQDISLSERRLINAVTSHTKFSITSHKLEFFGTCPQCQ